MDPAADSTNPATAGVNEQMTGMLMDSPHVRMTPLADGYRIFLPKVKQKVNHFTSPYESDPKLVWGTHEHGEHDSE